MRKGLRLALALLALGAPGASSVLGQGYGSSVSYTYDLATLSEKPGVIYVSPKYITVVEFSDLIDEIGTSRPALLQIRVAESGPNLMFLKALQQAGSADLVVRVGGYVALFKVVVDPKMDSPRRYVVVLRSKGSSGSSAGAANPTEAPRGEGAEPKEAQLPGGQAGGASLPSWLKASFSPERSANGWVIRYEVRNEGGEPLTLRVRDLTVRSGAVPLPFRVLRTSFGDDPETLAPGAAASGAIVVEEKGEIAWEWKVASPKTYYVLRGTAR